MNEAQCRVLLIHHFVSRVKVVVKSDREKHMSLDKNQPGFNERVALQKELELYETIF
jgi:hypothetical protein